MNKRVFAALAVLSVMLGSLSLVSAANAVYAPNGRATVWCDEPNG